MISFEEYKAKNTAKLAEVERYRKKWFGLLWLNRLVKFGILLFLLFYFFVWNYQYTLGLRELWPTLFVAFVIWVYISIKVLSYQKRYEQYRKLFGNRLIKPLLKEWGDNGSSYKAVEEGSYSEYKSRQGDDHKIEITVKPREIKKSGFYDRIHAKICNKSKNELTVKYYIENMTLGNFGYCYFKFYDLVIAKEGKVPYVGDSSGVDTREPPRTGRVRKRAIFMVVKEANPDKVKAAIGELQKKFKKKIRCRIDERTVYVEMPETWYFGYRRPREPVRRRHFLMPRFNKNVKRSGELERIYSNFVSLFEFVQELRNEE